MSESACVRACARKHEFDVLYCASSPGRQLLVLQTVCCSSGGLQARPPGSASCTSVLFRTDTPPPHEALHTLQEDHSLSSQSAGGESGETDENGAVILRKGPL